jgi:hypothetical protein
MKTRISLLVVFVMALALFAPIAQQPHSAKAQDGFTCPLTEEDCAILAAAIENSGTVTSFNIDALTLVMNMEAGDEGSADINLSGSGPINLVEGGVSPVEADLTFDGTMVSPDGEETISGARIVIKDDKAYSFDPEDGAWTVEEATAEDFEDMSDFNMQAILGGVSQLPAEAVTWARADDMEGMAVFTVDLHLAQLVVNEDFINGLAGMAGAMGDDSMTPESMSMMLSMLMGQLGSQLETAIVRFTFAVDPATSFVHGVSFDLDLDLDLSFLGAMAGGETQIPPISILVDMDTVFSGHNEAVEITVPEEAMAAEGETETEGETEGE